MRVTEVEKTKLCDVCSIGIPHDIATRLCREHDIYSSLSDWNDPLQTDNLRILVNKLRYIAILDPHLYEVADDLCTLLNKVGR